MRFLMMIVTLVFANVASGMEVMVNDYIFMFPEDAIKTLGEVDDPVALDDGGDYVTLISAAFEGQLPRYMITVSNIRGVTEDDCEGFWKTYHEDFSGEVVGDPVVTIEKHDSFKLYTSHGASIEGEGEMDIFMGCSDSESGGTIFSVEVVYLGKDSASEFREVVNGYIRDVDFVDD